MENISGGGAFYAPMYKFDIASGEVVDSFFAGVTQGINIHGIAIYGDQLKNCPAPEPNATVVKKIHVYPNPGPGSFTLETNLAGKITIRVFNKLGQPVFSKAFDLNGSNNKIPLDLLNLPPGYYVIQIRGKDEVRMQKIVIR